MHHLKINFLILILLVFSLSSFNPAANDGIKVHISNLRNSNGYVVLALYKNAVGYPDNAIKAYRKTKVSISNKTAYVEFLDLPTDSYAVVILHDENNDNKMNFNLVGIPKEGYGFSNNVMGALGPPDYSKARINHKENTTTKITIKVKY